MQIVNEMLHSQTSHARYIATHDGVRSAHMKSGA